MTRLNNNRKRQLRSLSYDREEGILWDMHYADQNPLAENSDWMMAPPEMCAIDGLPAKRRILRQFLHPCPVTGNLVVTREVEGHVFCFTSPTKGFLWTKRLTSDRREGVEGTDA